MVGLLCRGLAAFLLRVVVLGTAREETSSLL